MGSFSLAHWALVVLAAVLMFGRGRFPSALEDLGRGLGSLRRGLAEEPAARCPDDGAEPAPEA